MNVELTREQTYWLDRMTHPLPIIELPTNISRPPHYIHQPDSMTHVFPSEISRQVEMFSAKKSVPVTNILVTAYFALIYRITHEEDLFLGTPIVHQSSSTILPLRLSLATLHSFDELLAHVGERLEEAVNHACSFDFLLQHVFTAQEESRPVAYSTIFSMNGISLERVECACELVWQIHHTDEQLSLCAVYNALLFTKESIARFIGMYHNILKSMLTDENALFRTVDILTQEDLTLSAQLNQTTYDFPYDQTISQMFESAVERYADRLALSSDHAQLTYRELNEYANQIAHMLQANGINKGEFVAIFMDRSVETVISLLGITKAGGAYIPIDPTYPEDRIRYIIADSNAAFVITKPNHEDDLRNMITESGLSAHVISLDEQVRQYPTTPVTSNLTPDDLAYVIYTSGSTGRPKGTLLEHRGVINLSFWARDYFEIEPTDIVTQFASYSFDASVWETFPTLFFGARLHLLSNEERMSIEHFADAIQRLHVTIVMILPTVFFKQMAVYLCEESYKKLTTLKCINVAGEALTGEIVRIWQRRFGLGIPINNAYGPTEVTVITTYYPIRGQVPSHTANIPIGKPLYNYDIYVVSPSGQLCPVNVPGELYIGSVGISRGYLNQAEKTEEVFVPHPFAKEAGRMIYKSGDIVKLLPDGNIEYSGRKDNQVKIRGFRIEIGEIEDIFDKQDEVQEVAVIAKKDELGTYKLIAFYTVAKECQLEPEQVREFLSGQLPDYMIPEWIIKLDKMPISPTGKMDRKALAAIEGERKSSREYVHPKTNEQELFASAWQRILGIENIGIHDDFFSMGGHSLKILEILVLLKPHFPNLKIQDFFHYRTVETLAEYASTYGKATIGKKRSPTREIKDLVEGRVLHATVPYKLITKMPHHVLLTGATGYLGAYLLEQLIRQTDAHIYCMVRPSKDVWERLLDTATFYYDQPIIRQLEDRVTVIPGDLGAEGLGMSKEDWQLLRENVDTIIHAAADVRHFGDSDHFARVNIRGTEQLLDIAKSRKGIRFHHVSTISVPEELAMQGQWERFRKIKDYNYNVTLENVYANSKLQAEKVIRDAIHEGIPVTIYRAGNLVCHSKTGKFQRNIDSNAFYRMMKAILSLRATPKIEMYVDLTPIDYASEAIVRLACQPETIGRTFHIVNPEQITYKTFIELLNSLGYNIKIMLPEEYQNWLFTNTDKQNQEILQLAMTHFEGDAAKDSDYRFTCPDANKFLAYTSVLCVSPDRHFIFKLVDYAVQIGYFPTSEKWEEIKPTWTEWK